MTEACFVLLTASGLCFTLSGLILLFTIKIWNEAKSYFDLAWNLAHKHTPEKPEITE